ETSARQLEYASGEGWILQRTQWTQSMRCFSSSRDSMPSYGGLSGSVVHLGPVREGESGCGTSSGGILLGCIRPCGRDLDVCIGGRRAGRCGGGGPPRGGRPPGSCGVPRAPTQDKDAAPRRAWG